MNERTNIRLSGTGGQGLILAGIILAEAALAEGKIAIQSQSYGPEARGGASKAEVIIDSRPIYYPKVGDADILLSMSEKAYKKYGDALAEGATLILDTTFVEDDHNPKAGRIVAVPITRMAIEATGREMTANIVALGILSGLGVVAEKDIRAAVLHRVPKGTEDMNMKALEAGLAAVQAN